MADRRKSATPGQRHHHGTNHYNRQRQIDANSLLALRDQYGLSLSQRRTPRAFNKLRIFKIPRGRRSNNGGRGAAARVSGTSRGTTDGRTVPRGTGGASRRAPLRPSLADDEAQKPRPRTSGRRPRTTAPADGAGRARPEDWSTSRAFSPDARRDPRTEKRAAGCAPRERGGVRTTEGRAGAGGRTTGGDDNSVAHGRGARRRGPLRRDASPGRGERGRDRPAARLAGRGGSPP